MMMRCRATFLITTVISLGLASAAAAAAQAPTEPAAAPRTSTSAWTKEIPQIASGEWKGARLADGQPDVSGHWSNTVANHNNFTDPQGGVEGEPPRQPLPPRDQRAPSRVSDPADGQIPYLPHARAAQQDFAKNFPNPTKPQYIEPLARCAPGGPTKSLYWHGYEIRQFPGYVLFFFNSSTRIIRLDGKDHLPSNIKLWNADSRGHWEGNTLVVNVANSNGKSMLGRSGNFTSENTQLVERYVFDNDGKRYNYVATFTDPTIYSRPWTATIPARRYTEEDTAGGEWHYEALVANAPGQPLLHERMERICVENNGPFGGGAVGVPLTDPVISR